MSILDRVFINELIASIDTLTPISNGNISAESYGIFDISMKAASIVAMAPRPVNIGLMLSSLRKLSFFIAEAIIFIATPMAIMLTESLAICPPFLPTILAANAKTVIIPANANKAIPAFIRSLVGILDNTYIEAASTPIANAILRTAFDLRSQALALKFFSSP